MSDEVKRERLLEIKRNMFNRTYQDYENIINEGFITEDDMIAAGIITENSIKRLKNKEVDRIVDISPIVECPSKCTDVYFIGRPDPGITCLNMGLLASPNFSWIHNTYGQQLMQLCKMGLTPSYTSCHITYVTTGTINNTSNNKQHVNIIDFGSSTLQSMVDHTKDRVNFADMDMGITKMLLNDNEKVFFILIDPRAERYWIRRNRNEDDSTEVITVYQEQFLLKFLSLLEHPENKKVLDKVRSINVIVTKSDLLSDDRNERDEIAAKILREKYYHLIMKLKHLLKANRINRSSDYNPQMFTFSLGKFYYGGIFEYDSTDSEKLLNAISSMSSSHYRWHNKIIKLFNQ